MCDMVVDGNELDDTGRLRVLREIEDESKFVPSQFNRETQGQWGERRYNDGHVASATNEAKLRSLEMDLNMALTEAAEKDSDIVVNC